MNMRIASWASVVLLTAFCALSSRAADDTELLRDLTAVIALLGLPCGQVVSATRLNDNDHIATCRDGNRYRVFINAEGRVVAHKQ
ncbi:MAG: hypothetical protein Q8M01_05635 [Rubrivivax sp.]|nr:hypothetical protein [Rubrivivax sp.]